MTKTNILGMIMMVGSVFFAIYLGFWVCFIGGIASIINMFQTGSIEGVLFAWNVFKIVCAGGIGYAGFVVLYYPGYLLFIKN